MGYSTAEAEWPTIPVSPAVKSLIDKFLSLLDNKSPDVGDIFADQVFSSTGEATFGGKIYRGTEELRVSRDGAWGLFTRRSHRLLKVYASNNESSDLLCIGHVAMDLTNGKSVAGEFIARIRVAETQSDSPRLQSYSVWGDSSALMAALKGD